MSSDNADNVSPGHRRRNSANPGSSDLSALFLRRNSVSVGPTPIYPAPNSLNADPNHRRRLSISTGLGLSGTSPTTAFLRRSSMSTNSDSIDEGVFEDEPASASRARDPSTPFGNRRMSFNAQNTLGRLRASISGGSPGTTGTVPAGPVAPFFAATSPTNVTNPVQASAAGTRVARRHSISVHVEGPPPSGGGSIDRGESVLTVLAGRTARRRTSGGVGTPEHPEFRPGSSSNRFFPHADQSAFDWSEQLRARAQSSAAGRPAFGTSPPREHPPPPTGPPPAPKLAEASAPPPVPPTPRKPERQKPDHFQERILKGDFYMD